MRNISLISFIALFIFSSCSQSKMSNEIKELSYKVDSLTQKVDELSEQNKMMEEEFTWIENELFAFSQLKKSIKEPSVSTPAVKVTEKAVPDWQCLAITNSGSRCSRPALKGSKYCWQHKKTYEPDSPEKKTDPAVSGSGDPVK